MPLRSYLKAKFLVSQDNSANPTQVAFASGDVEVIDTTTYSEESSKTMSLPPSTVDHEVDMDTIATAAITFIKTDAPNVSVKLVPPGSVLGDVVAYALKAGHPMVIPCDLIGVYVSNSSTTDSAKVQVASVGN